MPILWHIMKRYSDFEFHKCTIYGGYKQHIIKEWFENHFLYTSDIIFDFTQEIKLSFITSIPKPGI